MKANLVFTLGGLKLLQTFNRFTQFYNHKYSGRKLALLHQLSKGELKTNYLKSAKTGYTLQVHFYLLLEMCCFVMKLFIKYRLTSPSFCRSPLTKWVFFYNIIPRHPTLLRNFNR